VEKQPKMAWFASSKRNISSSCFPCGKMLEKCWKFMKQTFILKLEDDLSVQFTFEDKTLAIEWSRGLVSNDIPILEEMYVPWRNNLLIDWSIRTGKRLDFADLPMIELVTRKGREKNP
jgi:hypothetical protein